jgi:phosphoribosylglycinamide formyltransferase-1
VLEDDTADSLAHRVFDEEKLAYPQAIRMFQENRLKIEDGRVEIIPKQNN